jgi:hypothetical protein
MVIKNRFLDLPSVAAHKNWLRLTERTNPESGLNAARLARFPAPVAMAGPAVGSGLYDLWLMRRCRFRIAIGRSERNPRERCSVPTANQTL